jgi:hypothetical protein
MSKRMRILGSLGIALLGVCDVKGEPQLLRLKNSVDWGVSCLRGTVEIFTKRIQENVARLERLGRLSPSPWIQAKAELVESYPFLTNLDPDTFPVLFFQEEFFVGTESQWRQWEWRCLRHNIDSLRYVARHILEVTDALEGLVNISEAISPQGTDTATADSRDGTPPWDNALLEALARSRLLPPWYPTEEDTPQGEDFDKPIELLKEPTPESFEELRKFLEIQIEQGKEKLRQELSPYLSDEEAISQCISTMNDVLQRHSLELDADYDGR